MIIESSKLINQNVNFFNKDIHFDKNGIATVEDEDIAKQIIDNFSDLVWEKGNKPEKQALPKVEDKDVMTLKSEISRLERVNLGLRDEIERTKESESTWRSECGKYTAFLKERGIEFEDPTIEPAIIEVTVPDGFEDVHNEMKSKNLADLKLWCKSELSVSEDVLEGFKGRSGKNDLIKYVFEHVIK